MMRRVAARYKDAYDDDGHEKNRCSTHHAFLPLNTKNQDRVRNR